MYCCSVGKRPGSGRGSHFPHKKQAVEPAPEAKPMLGKNNYLNDGSFMEQFMKMQGIKGNIQGILGTVLCTPKSWIKEPTG